MEEERKVLWEGAYITLFDDGTIGVSDGVGYIGEEEGLGGLRDALNSIKDKTS